MEKIHLIVDLKKCVGCYNCMIACKDEHVGNSWLPYTDEQQKHGQKWINPIKFERGAVPHTEIGFVTKLCQHCRKAPCATSRPEVISRRKDGVVIIDAKKAKGDKSLVDSCPYGMISWNEELETAQKCTMCAHLLDDGWKEPRCVGACPLRALRMVRCEDEEFERMVRDLLLKPLTDGSNAPRVMYRNLYKKDTCFIAGALALHDGEIKRTAEGAEVELRLGGELLTKVRADFFGEFKIDRIPQKSGTFELTCKLSGYKPIVTEVTVEESSPCLETMYFEKN
ncbi:MAG: oxidoreductase [Oscillospiraceae bacterium]|nr:oxidoreductase [Oscillospiraceae bacterium]